MSPRKYLGTYNYGVTACSPHAKNLSEVCENTPQLLFAKAEDVQNSKFKISTSGDVLIGLFSRQNDGGGTQHSMGL